MNDILPTTADAQEGDFVYPSLSMAHISEALSFWGSALRSKGSRWRCVCISRDGVERDMSKCTVRESGV